MKKTTKKRIMTIVVSIVTIITIMMSSVVGLKTYAAAKYWDSTNTIVSPIDWSFYDDIVEEINQTYKEEDEIVYRDIKRAKELPEKYKKIAENCKKAIIIYFQEEMAMDVTQKLSKMEAKIVDFSLEDLYGVFDNIYWDNTIYLLDELTQEDNPYYQEGLFQIVYIHEALHYLGGAPKGSQDMTYFYEGIVELLTEEICIYSKILYWEATYYTVNKTVAEQMLSAYPNMVIEIFSSEGNYELSKKLNAILENDYGEELEKLLTLALNGYNQKEIMFALQYITCELIKCGEKNEGIKEFKVVKNFEIEWLRRVA